MSTPAELNDYILQAIRDYVQAGFYQPDEVNQMVNDILEPGADEAMLRAAIPAEFARQAAAEVTWPAVTDCDRLDEVFRQLNANGILALQNAGYTTSDGHSDISQALHDHHAPKSWRGWCFYHGQDMERAVHGGGLWLAFGAIGAGTGPAEDAAIGQEVQAELERQGFAVDWDGSPKRKLSVPAFVWRRRQGSIAHGLRGWWSQLLLKE